MVLEHIIEHLSDNWQDYVYVTGTALAFIACVWAADYSLKTNLEYKIDEIKDYKDKRKIS